MDAPVGNGTLHPVLSNVFRVTDGLRMTLHQMLFVPIGEPAWAADAPVTAAELHAYAERNYSFHSETGVCAGPRMMVEEFLSVLIDGATPRNGFTPDLDPEVEDALDQLAPAMDYGLLGLQSYAVIFSLWPAMTRIYEALGDVADRWAERGGAKAQAIRNRLANHVMQIRRGSYLGDEIKRRQREAVYDDMYVECGRGLTGEAPVTGVTGMLDKLHLDKDLVDKIREALNAHFLEGADRQAVSDFAEVLADFLTREQAMLRFGAKV